MANTTKQTDTQARAVTHKLELDVERMTALTTELAAAEQNVTDYSAAVAVLPEGHARTDIEQRLAIATAAVRDHGKRKAGEHADAFAYAVNNDDAISVTIDQPDGVVAVYSPSLVDVVAEQRTLLDALDAFAAAVTAPEGYSDAIATHGVVVNIAVVDGALVLQPVKATAVKAKAKRGGGKNGSGPYTIATIGKPDGNHRFGPTAALAVGSTISNWSEVAQAARTDPADELKGINAKAVLISAFGITEQSN